MFGIKIQPRFVLAAKRAAIGIVLLCAAAFLIMAIVQSWRVLNADMVADALVFAFLSLFRSFVNWAFMLVGSVLLVWSLWYGMARWVVTGLRQPKFPTKAVVVALAAAVVLGAVLLPVDYKFNRTAKERLAPLAQQFVEKSGCNNSFCWSPDEILTARDRLLSEMNASRANGWSVRNPLGEGAIYNTRGLYFWRTPFFPFLRNW
jgi:hypothetical protein